MIIIANVWPFSPEQVKNTPSLILLLEKRKKPRVSKNSLRK
jgi:hypothetical protein